MNQQHDDQPLKTPNRQFRYWTADAFAKIVEEIDEIRDKPNARVEYHPHDHTLRLVADGYEGPPINDSLLCPPICP